MIPKIIHYCWFGGTQLDKLGQKCLNSWKKYFSNYKIVEWNENNFDINSCQYVKEAYEAKKWAFVSDYARFKILYEHGGVYFDTDVEAIKSFDEILKNGSFMGCETNGNIVAPGLGIATVPKMSIIKEIIDDYESSFFLKEDNSYDLTTIGERVTRILENYGFNKSIPQIQNVAELLIYPPEYFCPIDMTSGKLNITENTYSIHHYAASWESKTSILRGKIYRFLNRNFGENVADFVRKVFSEK